MLVALRRQYADLLTSGTQIGLVLFALHHPPRPVAVACLALAGAISLPAWLSAVRRARTIVDVPTSRVGSAAQGYVELKGRGRAPQGLPVLSPLTSLPCLWYRYRVERRVNDKWVAEETGESDASFILEDDSGQCLVDPEGAEILIPRADRWTQGERRYTQWLLAAGDPVYALGEFRTHCGLDLQLDAAADVRDLLAQWKQDRPRLLQRFDLDRDGEIDLREWELARRQAQREVAQVHREARSQSDLHVLRRPADGRMYLISSLDPEKLARRYRLWSAVHLLAFVGALGGAAWLWQAATP